MKYFYEMTISSSPHAHSPMTTRTIMRDVLIALVPALLGAIYFFGFRALTVTALYLLPQEEAGAQMDLFHGAQDQKRERLEKLAGAMDAIRAKYGKGAIAPASCPRDPGEDKHAPPPGGRND